MIRVVNLMFGLSLTVDLHQKRWIWYKPDVSFIFWKKII